MASEAVKAARVFLTLGFVGFLLVVPKLAIDYFGKADAAPPTTVPTRLAPPAPTSPVATAFAPATSEPTRPFPPPTVEPIVWTLPPTTVPPVGYGDQLIPIYAIPADRPISGALLEPLANDLTDALGWFDAQLGGRHPDVIIPEQPSLPIYPMQLEITEADLAVADDPNEALHDAVMAMLPEALRVHVPLIVFDGAVGDPYACGSTSGGETVAVVIPLGNCGGTITPEPDRPFPSGLAYLFAHELTHLLGGAPDCAPHNDGTNHVTDDRRDIIWAGDGVNERDWDNLMLDPGNDDYLGHGRTDCLDISTSRYLAGD